MNNLIMLASLLSVCHLAAADEISPVPRELPGEYLYYPGYSNNLYKHVPEQVTWIEAFDACNNDGDRAHLLIIDDDDEAVLAGIIFAKIAKSNNDLAHIGITDSVREGSWVTVSNEPVEALYHKWATGEPNRSRKNNDDCGAIDRRIQLNDIPCSGAFHKHAYICEREVDGL